MKGIFLLLFVSCSIFASAQNVGINTNAPVTTLQVIGAPAITTAADGITFPKLTGDQLKAKDAAYTATENGTIVFATSAVGSASAKTINVIAAGFYYYNGSVWIPLYSGITPGDIKSGIQSTDHSGWIKLDGRPKTSLTATQQAAATALGIGANLPDATNSVPLQNGSTLGSVSGSMSKTIAQNQLPNITVSGTTTSNGDHSHFTTFKYNVGNLAGTYNEPIAGHNGGGSWTDKYTSTTGAHTHNFTTSSINGGVTQQTLNVTPQSLSVNMFIYLGQ